MNIANFGFYFKIGFEKGLSPGVQPVTLGILDADNIPSLPRSPSVSKPEKVVAGVAPQKLADGPEPPDESELPNPLPTAATRKELPPPEPGKASEVPESAPLVIHTDPPDPSVSLRRPLLTTPFPQVFVAEATFLREVIAVLTVDRNEHMRFLTGPKLGPFRVIARWAEPVSLKQQSPVYVRAEARPVADVLIGIIEQGAELHVIAHSHPGLGEAATHPSGTDVQCLGKLQDNRSEAIGCIVSRDGYVRFFSISTQFHVMVVGTGVKEVSPNVFHISR